MSPDFNPAASARISKLLSTPAGRAAVLDLLEQHVPPEQRLTATLSVLRGVEASVCVLLLEGLALSIPLPYLADVIRAAWNAREKLKDIANRRAIATRLNRLWDTRNTILESTSRGATRSVEDDKAKRGQSFDVATFYATVYQLSIAMGGDRGFEDDGSFAHAPSPAAPQSSIGYPPRRPRLFKILKATSNRSHIATKAKMSARRSRMSPPQHIVSTGFSDPRRPAAPLLATDPLPISSDTLFWLEIGAPVEGAIDLVPELLPVDLLPDDAVLDVVLLSNDKALVVDGPARGVVAFRADGTIGVRTPAHVPGALAADDELLGRRLFFAVRTPPKPGEYRMRCGIYFRDILVQSREVRLRVGDAASVSQEPALVTRVDYVISRSLTPASLRAHDPHILSVIANRAGDGSHNFHFVAGETYQATATVDVAEVQSLVTGLRGTLRRVSWGAETEWTRDQPYRYGKDPSFLQLFRDLHALACAGFRAYDTIADRLGGGPDGADRLRERMRTPGLVQFALRESARLVLPLALLYDFPLDAALPANKCTLCPRFKRDVVDSTPLHEQMCFNGRCPYYDDDTVVCPGGFWGFRHALGVPLSLPTEGDSPSDIPGELRPADEVRLAVAVCTDAQLKHRAAHEVALHALLPAGRVDYADDRAETLEMMRVSAAQVLYFYCHGGVTDRVPYVQVGPLTDPGIERSTLRQKKIRWAEPRPRPLVFVNGCHTVDVEPDAAIEMVSGFVQTAGASAVMGTEITVFEPLAVAFGERFLRSFLRDRQPLGEAVRRSRLALLQTQLNPLGLVYVPFGMASLRLPPAA